MKPVSKASVAFNDSISTRSIRWMEACCTVGFIATCMVVEMAASTRHLPGA